MLPSSSAAHNFTELSCPFSHTTVTAAYTSTSQDMYNLTYVNSAQPILLQKLHTKKNVGRDNSVGIATHYGPDGPGIESRWGEIFRAQPPVPWVRDLFPGGKAGAN